MDHVAGRPFSLVEVLHAVGDPLNDLQPPAPVQQRAFSRCSCQLQKHKQHPDSSSFFFKKNKVLSCFASTEYVGVQAPPVHVLVHQDPFAGFVAVGKEAEHIPVLLEPGHELHLSREIPDDYVRKIADRFQPLHGNGSPG